MGEQVDMLEVKPEPMRKIFSRGIALSMQGNGFVADVLAFHDKAGSVEERVYLDYGDAIELNEWLSTYIAWCRGRRP